VILLIDNYDSFVHNLARYVEELGGVARVVRNDSVTVADVERMDAHGVILSPGPGVPERAGICMELVTALGPHIPMLGVCLGHQAIGAALGAHVVRAPEPMHGRTSTIHHSGRGLFAGLPQPLTATRYHSLIVAEHSLPDQLEVSARSEDGLVMALAHTRWPLFGVQFHPESVLTRSGHKLLANFLAVTGLTAIADVPSELPGPKGGDDFYTRSVDVCSTPLLRNRVG